MRKRHDFIHREAGSLAVIVALALPALLIGIGGAIEMSRAVTFRQKLNSAVELACTQAAAYVNAHKPLDVTATSTAITYPTQVADITLRNLTANGVALNPAPVATTTDTNVHIAATRSQPIIFSTLLNSAGFTFTASRDCAVLSTTAVQATKGLTPSVLMTESFETNQTVQNSGVGWEVDGGSAAWGLWNGWSLSGAGVEIDSQQAIAVSSVLFGSYFAELDSDCRTAANAGNIFCHTNSTMSRIMNLTPGTYQIRYWYVSRLQDPSIGDSVICGSKSSDVSYYTTNGQTNRIEVFVERSGSYVFSASNMVDVCVQSNNWVERVINFTVPSTSDYRISWRAAGREDTYGGLIDNLRICKNYCPAS